MKTLTVTLKDLEGEMHGSVPARTNVQVSARYTSDLTLADGSIVPAAVKVKPATGPGVWQFEVHASDDPLVRESSRGFAVVVEALVRGTREGTEWRVRRTVKPLEAMSSPISLGVLDPAEPVPPQWTTVGEVLGDFDARLDALESAPPPEPGDAVKVGGSAPATGWWLDTGLPEPDGTAPTAPSLTVDATSQTQLVATYTGGTDNIAVTQYRVRIDGGVWEVKTAAGSHTFGGLGIGTAHTIDAQAGDESGNWSPSTTWAGATSGGPEPEPSWLTLAASDDFERADTTAPGLGVAPVGGAWDDPSAAFWINTGRALTATNNSYATLDAASSDMKVSTPILAAATPTMTGPIACASTGSTATFYWARWNSGNVQLYRYINGSATKIGGDHPLAWPVGETHTLTLRAWDDGTNTTQLRVDLDGTTVISGSDTATNRPVGTRGGIRAQSSTIRFESFTIHTA